MLTKSYIGITTLISAAAVALCVLMMLATTPLGIGPFGVTAWFVSLLVGLSGWLGLAAYWAGRRWQPKLSSGKQVAVAMRRGIFGGGYLTILLALASLKQLELRDALLLLLLLGLLEFYLVARS
jgi:hypothetical protein